MADEKPPAQNIENNASDAMKPSAAEGESETRTTPENPNALEMSQAPMGQTPAPSPSVQPNQPKEQPMNSQTVQREQQRGRAEHLDYMRVLGYYAPVGSAPQNWISAAQEKHLGAHGGVSSNDIYPPPQQDSARVSPREVDKIRQVYQHHAVFPTALKSLAEHRCIVLHGEPTVGKRAAAIRLAIDLCGNNVPLWELSPEKDPAEQIQATILKPGSVYLIDGLLREKGQLLKSLAARTMLDVLESKSCFLIICTMSDVSFLSHLKVDLEQIAIPTKVVLEAHLEYYGPFTQEQMQAVMDYPSVSKLLEGNMPPAKIDRLAQQLATRLKKGGTPEQALHDFAIANEKDVRKWFDETADDVEESAFRAALAVFNGARYSFVNEAAQVLAKHWRPEPKDQLKAESSLYVSPLKKKRRPERLQEAKAELKEQIEPTEYSERATIEVVELKDPGYSTVLLKYLTEIDDWHEPFLDWLCDYAVNGPRDLRLRAAGAISALADLNFEYICEHVFYNWVITRADNPDERRKHYQALANALGVLIWNDSHAEDVLGLLRVWTDETREALQWAAARAYAQVGLRYPREAMNQWRRILESKERMDIRLSASFGLLLPHPLHMSVIDAILSLFLRSTEFPERLRPVYEQALEGLADWVDADAKENESQQVGLPLFLALTSIRYPPEEGKGNPEDWPPAMLYIINTQPDYSTYRHNLCKLIRGALNHRNAIISQWAVMVLKDWTERADKDPWLEQTLTALLRDMLESSKPKMSERECNRLSVSLLRWADHPITPLNVAGRILKELKLN